MNKTLRFVVTAIGAPFAALLVSWAADAAEMGIRYFLNKPAIVDDTAVRADVLFGSLIFPAFVFFCWIYVLPIVSLSIRRGPLIASVIVTVPIWLIATIVFHTVRPDSLWFNISATALFIGLPVFAASLFTAIIIRPNPTFKRDALKRAP